jgi:dipeptidyl aminopeptidase/acylaminoacyl peptidase
VLSNRALVGYTVALVNYPGSTGYGQEPVDRLTRELGTLDVEACRAVPAFLSSQGFTIDKTYLFGGSHGGFIISHLLARWPDEFAAAAMANVSPSLSNPSDYFASDALTLRLQYSLSPTWSLAYQGPTFPIGSFFF